MFSPEPSRCPNPRKHSGDPSGLINEWQLPASWASWGEALGWRLKHQLRNFWAKGVFLGPLIIVFFPNGLTEWGAKAAVRKGICAAFSGGGVTVVLGDTFCLLLQIHLHPAFALGLYTVWTLSADFLAIGLGLGLANEKSLAGHKREEGQWD